MQNNVRRDSGPDIRICGGCESLSSEIVEWGERSIAICSICKAFQEVSFLLVKYGKSQDLSRQEVAQIDSQMVAEAVRCLAGPHEVTPVLARGDEMDFACL